MSAAPLAIATVTFCTSTSAKRGATSTRSEKPITDTGLNPWDIAAGSLMVTEAGGLIGNFIGESVYMYQREVMAGNPKIYAQMVDLLSKYTA